MGLIYKNSVNETKIYKAYGLTVYGEIHEYEWMIDNYRREKAITSIRIVDENNKDVFSMILGNNCILWHAIDDGLMDDFLFWMVNCPEEVKDSNSIKRQVNVSLCKGESLFNHRIRQLKQRKREEEKRKEEIAKEEAKKDFIRLYCEENRLIPYFTYCNDTYLLKPYNDKVLDFIIKSIKDYKEMENIISFIEEYPDNKDVCIVKKGKMNDILDFINGCGKK